MRLLRQQTGFSAIEALLIIVIIGIIGGTGWYVWHSKQATDKSLTNSASSQPATQSTKKAHAPVTTNAKDITLASSQIKLTYDPNTWDVTENSSNTNQYCGKQDSLTLAYKANHNFTTSFQFGQCGKGGGDCVGSGSICTADSKSLATVDLKDSQTAYVIAHRVISNGSDKMPQYSLWLADKSNCTNMFCMLTVPSLDSKSGLVFAQFSGEGTIPGNPQSTDDFVKLAPVQAALSLLKTAHY